MSKTHRIMSMIVILSFCLLGWSTAGFGEMRIRLKSGKVISVPVNAEDITSISFGKTAPAGGGQATTGGAGVGADITWDFESGSLKGWNKTGTAFNFQPTYGDNPTARKRKQPSGHQGHYWIGGFEKRPNPRAKAGNTQGDTPQGTLTSDSFEITRPGLSFLIGGGCDIKMVRVELLINDRVVKNATGKCNETMKRVKWNVSKYQGQMARIRIVDKSSLGWGHINVDDFRFE